ncbi:hypothetical protein G5C51_24555 [Streptomyces sp. A7024]|uniref:Type II secretion system protein GspF domain-containing protein n=1 Tax=Streptomyces coryli TaxID=1128680 RepID=A0A6G4U5T4_9ACTN|nr:type II secretion system F family protein [Streptomyces coryli]NGN67066.1 hypothetical protein [Streptomyces coryli]
MTNLALLTIGLTLLCGLTAVVGVHSFSAGKADRQALIDRLAQTGEIDLGKGRRRNFRGVDRRLKRTNFGKKLEMRIAATGMDLTVGEFFVYMVAGVVGLWLVASSVLASFFGPIFGLVALWGAFAYLSWQRQKRIERFIAQLPELSRVLANATRAGLALRTALSMAADEMEAPAGDELGVVADKLALGHSIDDALGELAERLPSRELTVLVSTLVLSNKAGGTVVESLRNLTETLEERKETRREVRTMLSQANVTAYAVPSIGLGVLIMLNSIQAGTLDKMTGSFAGQAAAIAAIALYAIGFIIIRRICKIDV